MSDLYNGLVNDADILVPVKAATVYAAHEASLFLGGQLIPVVQAPNGLARIPVLSGGTAWKLSDETDAVDVDAAKVTSTGVDIVCDLYAARTVVRDLGAVDANEIGRQLGNSIAAGFDADVGTAMASLTAYSEATATVLSMDDIYGAIGAIRAAGETGNLFGFVSANKYAAVMALIGSTNFAGGNWQGAALQSGALGAIAGCQFFVTKNLTSSVAIMGQDAMRIAMQKNVSVEIARRPEAVGQDCVASLHAKAAIVDATRGRFINLAS